MTTIDALKNLYVELGGNLEDVENINVIPKMIDALSEIAGSTIELPGVTSEDNGDILTVVDGKWAKGQAGGAKKLEVGDNGSQLLLPGGVKESDIFAELENGINMVIIPSSGTAAGIIFPYIGKNGGYHFFTLTYLDYASSKVYNMLIKVQNDNTSTKLSYYKNQLSITT